MKFENTGLESAKVELNRLDELMAGYGLIREATWDYDRVTYDRKFELREGVFYLRVQGFAEGDVGAHKAEIKLITPLLGKYYFPHGVEYGAGEEFPSSLVSQCEKILADIKNQITAITQ